MCLGFLGAGYLINRSYSEWLKSPVATSITTHPIADLDFPTVTVCPPKGSHTPLNYDLMKADNDSLTEDERKDLKLALFEIMMEPTHQAFIKSMLANPIDVKQIYKGFQSTPKLSKTLEVETRIWNINGTLQTPRFGEEYDKNRYKENKDHKVILQFPEDIKEQVR